MLSGACQNVKFVYPEKLMQKSVVILKVLKFSHLRKIVK